MVTFMGEARVVGRERELALLDDAMRAAMGGSGRVLLVRGEPGIGKSSLARAAWAGAAALGLNAVWGRASEAEGAPPFWPWRQVVDIDAETFAAGDRFVAFEEVVHRLVEGADQTGAFVVLDDLHWADPGTVALFVHVAHAIENSRLVLLGTYRDTEPGRTDLVRSLSGLAGRSWVTFVRLAGLCDVDVARQLAAVTRTSVDEATVSRVVRRTRGNPFFVVELGRVLADGSGDELPDAVRAAIERRLSALPDAAQGVVAAASVLGDAGDPGALAAVADLPLDAVLDGTDLAVGAGVLDAGLGIAHDLISEAARAGIGSRRLLGMHARAGDYLRARPDAEEHADEIAHHLVSALPLGDPAAAVAWAERAAARAREQLAWEQAAGLLRRAAAAADDSAERGRLLQAQARAELQGYDVGAAFETLQGAAAIARTSPDATALAEVALILEGFADMNRQSEIRGLCREALSALPESDLVRRARLLAQLAVHAQLVDAVDPAEDLSGQALAAAERLGDPRTLASALHARQLARSGPDGVHERLELGDRLLGLAAALDDPTEALWGRLWRFDALLQLGRLDSAEAEIGPMAGIAERTRLPLARWHVLRSRGAVAFARGRFAEAEAVADEVAELSRRAGHGGGLMSSELVTILARTQTGAPLPDHLLRDTQGWDLAAARTGLVGIWYLTAGNLDEARRRFALFPRADSVPTFVRLTMLAAAIEMAAGLGDLPAVRDAYDRLLPYGPLFSCGGAGAVAVSGCVHGWLGVGAAALKRWDDAERHLRVAIAANEQAGTPPFTARAQYDLARVLVARDRRGDPDEASALAALATSTAERLGMAPLLRRCTDLAASGGGGPLTRREREIAAFVAQGLTNRQIAAATHTSERTVETHVRHCLAKLGLTSRAELAGWVREIRTRST